MRLNVLLATSLLFIAACGQDAAQTTIEPEQPEQSAAVDSETVTGIAWFDGTVDEAFAHAAETGKPIYLYWGAEWCPPCHAIKATVFSKPEFVERSKLFVPVYLDGDQPNAQAQGERFGVLGYPTMIVFDSAGNELTRIPNGIDIEAYARILDLAMNASSSASAVVARLMDGNAEISPAECRLLAYHAWEQDPEILANYEAADAFLRMYTACPPAQRTERSVLFLSWLDAAIEALEEGASLSAAQREEGREWVEAVAADRDLSEANILRLLLFGPKYVKALTDAGTGSRERLVAAFQSAFDRIAADETVYKRERIYTLAGRIGFERLDDDEAPISEGLANRIREMTAWADESTPSAYERQPIINALANVLKDAGMDDVARPLLLAELDRSKQPYYFMAKLGGIEQRAGNFDAAIEWYEKAYASARGPATRFQWGYYYLQSLIEMAPEDTQRIHDTAVALITELQQSGGFHLRPKAQLAQLEASLLEWGESHGKALAELQDSVRTACETMPTEDDTCRSFLVEA